MKRQLLATLGIFASALLTLADASGQGVTKGPDPILPATPSAATPQTGEMAKPAFPPPDKKPPPPAVAAKPSPSPKAEPTPKPPTKIEAKSKTPVKSAVRRKSSDTATPRVGHPPPSAKPRPAHHR